ncbi:MAG: hypothetical protein JST40_00315 [Armatimonadetes bacterium]|nr:hypothetical protein [Armatimonadota bacterium]
MKKVSLLLMCLMGLGILAGCGEQKAEVSADEQKNFEHPSKEIPAEAGGPPPAANPGK